MDNFEDKKPIVYTDNNGKPDGEGSISYISFETLKKNLEKDLSNPMANRMEVIQYYRKTFIENALLIKRVRKIHTNKKHEKPDFVISALLPIGELLDLDNTKKAVDELIQFENYLNEIESTLKEKNEPQRETKKNNTVELKDFFSDEIKADTVNSIQDKFKSYPDKKLAILINLLNQEYKLLKIDNNDRKKFSRIHFVRSLKKDPDIKTISGINNYIEGSTGNLARITNKDTAYLSVEKELKKMISSV